MTTAGVPQHKTLKEREMINGCLFCETCPEEDGIKGKWKLETEFYSKPHRSRGRDKRCKSCVIAGNAPEKVEGAKANKRSRPPTDPDFDNKRRFQTAERPEPMHSLSTFMARQVWNSNLNFEGVTG